MTNNEKETGASQGDVFNITQSGHGSVAGKNLHFSGTINVAAGQLDRVPNEYAPSLQAFAEAVNKLLQEHKVAPEQVAPVQKSIDELRKELETVGPEEKIKTVKKDSIKAKLGAVAEGLVGLLPKTAETVSAFTPLAPFSKLIGEGVEQLVKRIQEEA